MEMSPRTVPPGGVSRLLLTGSSLDLCPHGLGNSWKRTPFPYQPKTTDF